MLQSFQEGGWAMFLIFGLGLTAVGAGLRFAWKGEHQLTKFLLHNIAAVLLAGLLGFFVGMMRVLWFLTERTPEGERLVILMIGTREAANNLAAALLFAMVATTLVAIGYRRFPFPNPSALS
jgi:uncharacterized membrane protein YqgA involved in biofilm formation